MLNAAHVSVKAAHKPASRQYMMMGVGVLVLLLLIIGIGSALKALYVFQRAVGLWRKEYRSFR